jgi:hypothetical protein
MRTLILVVLVFTACSASGQQSEPIASVTKPMRTSGPTRTFKLFREPAFSNWYYRIVVCSEDGSHVLQEITGIRNGIDVARQPHSFEISVPEGNGFADIRLLGGFDRDDGKAWYKVWSYQPATSSYVFRPSNP